jgi:hypothetical protein
MNSQIYVVTPDIGSLTSKEECNVLYNLGIRTGADAVVEALCYKMEGRGFDSR